MPQGGDAGEALEALLMYSSKYRGVSWRVGVLPAYIDDEEAAAEKAASAALKRKSKLSRKNETDADGASKPAVMQVGYPGSRLAQ